MAEIFISYRREDTEHFTGRLRQSLVERFGESSVFLDRRSLLGGDDFAKVIEQQLAQCRAVIVVIGPHWLRAAGEDGRRRLEEPDDMVRLEVEQAMARGDNARVIPLLVDKAEPPSVRDLPPQLAGLMRLQCHRIDNDHFEYDVGKLINTLEQQYGALRRAKRYLLEGVFAATAAAVLWLLAYFDARSFGMATFAALVVTSIMAMLLREGR